MCRELVDAHALMAGRLGSRLIAGFSSKDWRHDSADHGRDLPSRHRERMGPHRATLQAAQRRKESRLRMDDPPGIALMWTALAALAATLSALFAALYTWLTYRLVRPQSEPNVVIYVRHDESRASIIQIVITNIGRGLATDLRLETDRQVPRQAFGFSDDAGSQVVHPMADGPLVEGIPTLGPGDSRRITWGQYWGLRRALDGRPVLVTCRYRHGNRDAACQGHIRGWLVRNYRRHRFGRRSGNQRTAPNCGYGRKAGTQTRKAGDEGESSGVPG